MDARSIMGIDQICVVLDQLAEDENGYKALTDERLVQRRVVVESLEWYVHHGSLSLDQQQKIGEYLSALLYVMDPDTILISDNVRLAAIQAILDDRRPDR